ncbi:hypothetical protein BpHYR1_007652 [Brachionus plicatilis]|uniref:Uncharacterized protein n=1 Tax=Brachionus plicatilis TaxID=10195 RepID=A0A3M7RXC3_BRAPC|nr:hypothetical protein BpHYR1_007652 [Brachionus plicatilis]
MFTLEKTRGYIPLNISSGFLPEYILLFPGLVLKDIFLLKNLGFAKHTILRKDILSLRSHTLIKY